MCDLALEFVAGRLAADEEPSAGRTGRGGLNAELFGRWAAGILANAKRAEVDLPKRSPSVRLELFVLGGGRV